MEGDYLKQIILNIKNSDEGSFRKLFDYYYPRFLRVAQYHVKKDEIAEEVVMDVFVKLWKYRKNLPAINSFKNYFYTAVKNQSMNYLKKNSINTESLDDQIHSNLIEYIEPEKVFLGRELAREIEKTVSNLPPRCQLIYRMVREDGMKYKEVASALEISLKAVENQLLIAMKRIKNAVNIYTENAARKLTMSKAGVYMSFIYIFSTFI